METQKILNGVFKRRIKDLIERLEENYKNPVLQQHVIDGIKQEINKLEKQIK